MELTWIDILFLLILIDSVGAVWFSYFGRKWYLHHIGFMAQYFPPAKGWSVVYFAMAVLLLLTHFTVLPT